MIEDYEKKRWPIEPPDPVDAIRYRMETGGFTQADLGRLIGSRQRASTICLPASGNSMQMAWKLRESGIPPDSSSPAGVRDGHIASRRNSKRSPD